jgi:hypothetical protein
MERDDILSLT